MLCNSSFCWPCQQYSLCSYYPTQGALCLLSSFYSSVQCGHPIFYCIINSKIKIIEWGGHSIGSSIVEINTGNAIHIFAGDECYINANIENKICTGSFYNKEKSIKFVEKYSNKKYFVHTCHDISLKTERIIYRYTR